MEQLIVRDRVINKDIMSILYDIQSSCRNGKLSQFKVSGTGIAVTCPSHNDGKEKRPSCFINIQNENVPVGMTHCFTCGFKGSFSKFVGECFNKGEEWGENWLLANYASDYIKRELVLPEISFDNEKSESIDESILNKFESYHPYMSQRGISDDIIKKFNIKYDPETKCIVFPIRDRHGKLKYLTRRSVEGKKFIIDSLANKKDMFGLSEVIKGNYRDCIICESQINALNAWSWGYPAIALLGAGTTREQMDELNNTSIKRFILCYDGDNAGRKGAERFKKLISKNKLVDQIDFPDGKDLADMGKDWFETSLHSIGDCLKYN